MGAMTTALRRTTRAPIQVTQWGCLNKTLQMHSTVSLRLGSAMLLWTGSGSNPVVNQVILKQRGKVRPWFEDVGNLSGGNQSNILQGGHEKPSLHGPSKYEADWCRQRNGRMHQFSQPSSAGSKIITAAEENYPVGHKKSPLTVTLHAPSIYTCKQQGPRENGHEKPNYGTIIKTLERNGIMHTRAYLALKRD